MFILNHEKATILLSLPHILIPEKVSSVAISEGFKIKSEFHLTIISFQNGKKLVQAGVDFQKVVELAESFTWDVAFLPEYFILERTIGEFVLHGKVQTPKHTRRSIVQSLQVSDMGNFFEKLSEMTGIHFETPIPHVTLFSWSDYEPEIMSGLSLNSQADFNKYYIGSIL